MRTLLDLRLQDAPDLSLQIAGHDAHRVGRETIGASIHALGGPAAIAQAGAAVQPSTLPWEDSPGGFDFHLGILRRG